MAEKSNPSLRSFEMKDLQRITRLGRGAFSEVFLYKNKITNKQIAVKQVGIDEKKKFSSKKFILRECRILSEVKHVNIVGCIGYLCDESDQLVYIGLEYCQGGTLYDVVIEKKKKGTFIEESVILQWFLQISLALHYLHENAILHRDLKTENVFLTKDRVTCKLGDFGISKELDSSMAVSQTWCGTPSYIAPEIWKSVPYTNKADVWSLGVILYEVIALQLPFEGIALPTLYEQIVNGEPKDLPPECSRGLAELVSSLLTKEARNRPTVRQMLRKPLLRNVFDDVLLSKKQERKEKRAGRPLLSDVTAKNELPSRAPERGSGVFGGGCGSQSRQSDSAKSGQSGWMGFSGGIAKNQILVDTPEVVATTGNAKRRHGLERSDTSRTLTEEMVAHRRSPVGESDAMEHSSSSELSQSSSGSSSDGSESSRTGENSSDDDRSDDDRSDDDRSDDDRSDDDRCVNNRVVNHRSTLAEIPPKRDCWNSAGPLFSRRAAAKQNVNDQNVVGGTVEDAMQLLECEQESDVESSIASEHDYSMEDFEQISGDSDDEDGFDEMRRCASALTGDTCDERLIFEPAEVSIEALKKYFGRSITAQPNKLRLFPDAL